MVLNGNGFAYLFDGERFADAVLRPYDKPFVVHELSVGIEMFLILFAAESIEIGEIFVGREFDLIVCIYAPMPFAYFPTSDIFGDIVVAEQGKGNDAAGSFEELFSVHDGVTHNDDLL